jgi:D-alanyl-D-alanine carboxypeptidase/D-alanyl-D-alanine-endopeptidase (penicillin-binding protein 4)
MRRGLVGLLILGFLLGSAAPAGARPAWKQKIDDLVRDRSVSVAVRHQGAPLYRWAANQTKVPASGQKLLLSMGVLGTFPASHRLTTRVVTAQPLTPGVIKGDIWVLGEGDPTLSNGGAFAKGLSIKATRINRLARGIADTGVVRIQGSVVGGTTYFARDHWATGWKDYFPARYIALPTALAFDANREDGKHIYDPELRVARALTRRLRTLGVKVDGAPQVGAAPKTAHEIAQVSSVPLSVLLRFMNRKSSNFFAEMMGKRLAVQATGQPGTIAAGASATQNWAAGRGVQIQAHDGSGLSYSNRASPDGVTRLLESTEAEPWVETLRFSLPKGGQGTLKNRLRNVQVRAKTGTLSSISVLSGWVWLERTDSWAQFSIMSDGMSKSTASDIEDRIVRRLSADAR